MADLSFYRLTETRLESALPQLLEKSLARGWRVVVQTPDDERRDAIDRLLWTYREDSFLPHGLDTCDFAAEHPILLTTSEVNPNQASVRFLIDGAPTADIGSYERVVYMFDGFDEALKEKARDDWRRYRAEGHVMASYRQTETGGWFKEM